MSSLADVSTGRPSGGLLGLSARVERARRMSIDLTTRDVVPLCIGAAVVAGVVHQVLPLLTSPIQALLAPVAFLAGAGCLAFRRRVSAAPSVPTTIEPRLTETPADVVPAPAPSCETSLRTTVDEARASAIERAASDLKGHPVFTNILCEQLSSVTETSQDAAGKILEGLMSVDGQIDALMSFIQQSGSNERVSEVVSDIEDQIHGCRDQLGRFVSCQVLEAEQVALQRTRLQGETQSVVAALDGIGAIARQTTMLSINVAIQAARAGDVGKGFMVIGTEIRTLAQEVHILAKEINLRIESLMRTVMVDFQERADTRAQMERTSVASIVETLDALAENVMTLLTHQRDVLQKVETENEAISRPILDMMGSIQFQDITRQRIEQLDTMARMVTEHMALLADHLADPAGLADFEPLSTKLDQLFDGYVMDSQRTTHRNVQGRVSNDPPAVAAIELF